jgi:hypothetical protein
MSVWKNLFITTTLHLFNLWSGLSHMYREKESALEEMGECPSPRPARHCVLTLEGFPGIQK